MHILTNGSADKEVGWGINRMLLPAWAASLRSPHTIILSIVCLILTGEMAHTVHQINGAWHVCQDI